MPKFANALARRKLILEVLLFRASLFRTELEISESARAAIPKYACRF